MPFTVEWDGAGLIKQLTGFVGASEFSRSAEATTSHREFDRAKYVINDFTGVTGTDLIGALENVAVMRIGGSCTNAKLRVAYVHQDEEIKRFVAELLSGALSCGWETGVFATREEAIRWATDSC
jgi:hypothetical protein